MPFGLAGSALQVAGGFYGNYLSSKEAQKNRDWQERMSNTSHQREVADLRAAGLNPLLSANSGASVGSGATAQQDNPAAGIADTLQRNPLIRAQKKNLDEQNENIQEDTNLKRFQSGLASVNINTALSQDAFNRANTALAYAQAEKESQLGRTARINADFDEEYLHAVRALGAANSASSLFQGVVKGLGKGAAQFFRR